MQRHIPQEVVEREKQGFSGPDASWFKGQSIDFVRRIIFDDGAEIYRYLDPKPLRELVNDHLEGRENRRLLIWSLINVELALQTQVYGYDSRVEFSRSMMGEQRSKNISERVSASAYRTL